MDRKLVLFDIDGTLVYHVGTGLPYRSRVGEAVTATWHVPIDTKVLERFDGWLDRGTAWEIVKSQGVTREAFDQKFSQFVESMNRSMAKRAKEGKIFEAIADAKRFTQLLKKRPNTYLGLLTGNVQSIAQWKLDHAGIQGLFDFGLFGDEADDRITLAGMAFAKAKAHFGIEFTPGQVVVIGDTVYDIRCGKSIGATTIAVLTGFHKEKETLAAEAPDFLVESLVDAAILRFFRLTAS